MAASGYAVTISANDKFTGPLDAFNRKLAAMQAPVTRLHASLQKFSQVSGISTMSAAVGKLNSHVQGISASAARAIPALGGITSAASIAGVIALTQRFGEFGTQLGFAAQNIGISAQGLHGFENAMRLSGVSGEAAASSMQNLSQSITDAAGGRNMEALGYFRQLGVNIRNANGSLKTAGELMPDVADSLQKISNPALRLRVGAALGLSAEAVAVLSRGSDALRKQTDAAARYGLLNDAGVASAEKMRGSIAGVTQSFEGLGYAIAQKLEPTLSPMLDHLGNWVASHRTDIADAVERIARQFDGWAKSGGIEKLTTGIGEMATAIDKTVKYFGGWEVAAGLLGLALTAKVLSPLTSIALALTRLGGIAIPAWLGGLLGIGGGGVAALGATLALHGDTFDPNKNKKPFLGEGAYDSPYLDPRNPHAAKPVGQAVEDWWHGSTNPAAGGALSLGVTGPEYSQFRAAVAGKEGSRYDQMGGSSNRFAGKYQFGADEIAETAKRLGIATPTQAEFLANPSMQEQFFDAYTAGHHEQLMRTSPEYAAMTPQKRLQALGYAHNQGAGGAASWLRTGVSGTDAFGTSGSSYADAVAGRMGMPSGNGGVVSGPYSGQVMPSGGGQSGTIKSEVIFRNAPPGMSVTTTSSGNVQATARVETTGILAPR